MNVARYTCPINVSRIAKNFAQVLTGVISPGPRVVSVAIKTVGDFIIHIDEGIWGEDKN